MQFYSTKNTKTLKDFLDRFWSYVLIPQQATDEDCWEWVGAKFKNGYGRIRFSGFIESAHRVAYHIYRGGIVDSLLVTHTCDCPPCVNPFHLVQGTYSYNAADCNNKGRNPRLKIKADEYFGIRKMKHDGSSLLEIATRYGCSPRTIWGIT